MIQRIQSILLFVASIASLIVLFIPIGYIYTDEVVYIFDSFFVKENIPNGAVVLYTFYIALFLIVSSILSFYTIFQYKNRKKQLKLNNYNMILFLLIVVFMLYICPEQIFVYKKLLSPSDSFDPNKWIFISIIPPFCLFLANRYIKKDEKRVRAADRLR